MAGVSQDVVSNLELGRLDRSTVRALRAVTRALDMDVVIDVRWRGGDLDRLEDAGHAALVARVVALLRSLGWEAQAEVSFAVYGERGSIDVLAWHPASRTLLVVEVKTTLNSIEETLRRHDVKVRLAAGVARERFGWSPSGTARLLVLADDATARRRVRAFAHVFDAVYPLRGRQSTAWLRRPSRGAGLLLFLSLTIQERGRQRPVRRRRQRVRGTPGGSGQVRLGSVDDRNGGPFPG